MIWSFVEFRYKFSLVFFFIWLVRVFRRLFSLCVVRLWFDKKYGGIFGADISEFLFVILLFVEDKGWSRSRCLLFRAILLFSFIYLYRIWG